MRALVTFVKGIDPRIVKIEAERKRRRAEEDALRAEQRAADLQAKKELKIRRQQQLEVPYAAHLFSIISSTWLMRTVSV